MKKKLLSLSALLLASPLALADLPGGDKLGDLQRDLEQRAESFQRLENAGGKCLDVPDPQANGGKAQLWDCNDAPNQRWKWDNGRLINAGGKCLDAPDPKANGGKVQLWDCNDAPNQQWQENQGRLRNKDGKCLDAPDPKANGGKVQLWDCNDAPNQQWKMQ